MLLTVILIIISFPSPTLFRPRCCTTRSSAAGWTLCSSQRLGLPATHRRPYLATSRRHITPSSTFLDSCARAVRRAVAVSPLCSATTSSSGVTHCLTVSVLVRSKHSSSLSVCHHCHAPCFTSTDLSGSQRSLSLSTS